MPRVIKLSSSLLESPVRIGKVADNIIRSLNSNGNVEPDNIIIVSSNIGFISNEIYALGKDATNNSKKLIDIKSKAENLKKSCIELLKECVVVPSNTASNVVERHETFDFYSKRIEECFKEINSLLHGFYLLKESTQRALNSLSSFGELISSYIVYAAFKAKSNGCEYIDLSNEITINENKNNKILIDENIEKLREIINKKTNLPTSNNILVTPGNLGSNPQGVLTIVGKGGHEITACLLAICTKAKIIELWSEKDGMKTVDPSIVKNSFTLEKLSYSEAMEMCHFGDDTLYPPAIALASQYEIPIKVKNCCSDSFAGTIISRIPSGKQFNISGIVNIDDVSIVKVQGAGLAGVTGSINRICRAIAAEKINVILMVQGSSENNICFVISTSDVIKAKQAIEDEFKNEINCNLIDKIQPENDLSVISVIGNRMKECPGVAAKIFSSLGRNGINLIAIAQGSTELNISTVIKSKYKDKALKALHDSFFKSTSLTANIFIAGTGLIGSTLLEQISSHKETLLENQNIDIKLIGISNSKGSVISQEGLEFNKNISNSKNFKNTSTEEFLNEIIKLNLPNAVFVDCTANKEVSSLYKRVLESHIPVVTPNKIAQSGDLDSYLELKNISKSSGIPFLYETSVGAGLPVISTIRDLIRSGDKITKIEAILSGTLSYLFNSFDGITPLSEVIANAKSLGLTEPDPRLDLGGIDVARKIVILARECGFNFDFSKVQIKSLVPDDCENAESVEEFFELFKSHDAYYSARYRDAKNSSKKLCYMADFTAENASASLRAIDLTHPFASLSGSDNIIAIYSERYKDQPLVIQGPGAGAEVTAAGVFADIIRVCNPLT